MKIIYKKGFSLEIWHDFQLGQPQVSPIFLPNNYNISDAIILMPSQECACILRNLRWIFRSQSAGANLFADVQENSATDASSEEVFQTILPVNKPYRLTFWLMARDHNFSNYTNLSLANSSQQIYYLSNQWNNQQNGVIFLSQPLPPYAAGESYALGQLVRHEENTLEALRPLAGSPEVPDPNDWEVLPASQYVSVGDRLTRQKRYWQGTISAANPGEVFLFQLRDGNGMIAFSTEITLPDSHSVDNPFPVKLDFADLSPGRYQLLQQEEVIDEFVFADVPEAQTALALVEIFVGADIVDPDLSPIRRQDQQTILQSQTYVIRFKNRATRWRYRYQRPHGCTLTNLPNDFTLIDDLTYVTARPIGLRQQPDQLLLDCQDDLLPSPTVTQIKPEMDENHSVIQIFSDVYL